MFAGTTGAADPRRQKPAPMSADVGAALVRKRQMAEQPTMMDEGSMMPPDAGMPMEGAPMEGAAPPPQQVLADTVEQFDPETEHSASASRNALAEGIQRAMGLRAPQNPRTRPAYNKTQLAQLGLPPSEIELLSMQEG